MALILPFNRRTKCQNIKLIFCRRTLEELRSIFDIPTKDHIAYRVKVVAPWLAKKYLRPWAVRLHIWRKPKATVIPIPEFHDWYRTTQRLANNPVRSERATE